MPTEGLAPPSASVDLYSLLQHAMPFPGAADVPGAVAYDPGEPVVVPLCLTASVLLLRGVDIAQDGGRTTAHWSWDVRPRGALRFLGPRVGWAGRRLEPTARGDGNEHVEVTTSSATRPHRRETGTRPLLGLRGRPGRLALLVFRLPLPLYRAGWGRLFLGHTFLVLTHVGRKTGKSHATAAMVLAEDKTTGEAVICSVWGPHADWIRNLHAHPALRVQIGRSSFVPQHRFLTGEEAFAVGAEFRHHHPWRVRLISRVLGVDLGSDAGIHDFVDTRPFVALRPAASSAGVNGGAESARSAAGCPDMEGDEQPCVPCT